MKMTNKFGKGQILSALEKCGFEFENKKNNFKKYTPLVGALLLALVAFFFVSVLPVSAAENTDSAEEYNYSFVFTESYYDSSDVLTSSGSVNYLYKSNKPLKIVSFRYQYEAEAWGEVYSCDTMRYYILPENQSDISTEVLFSKDGGNTWTSLPCGTQTIDDTTLYMFTYGNFDFYNLVYGGYKVGTTNLSCMHVSGQEQIDEVLKEIANGNWDSYEEETEEIEIDWDSATKNNTFGLNNYTATIYGDTLTATWNGVSSRKVDISDYKNTYVRSCLTFCPIGSNGANGIVVELPINAINDNGFSLNISDYSPAIDYYLYSLESVPYYYSGDDIAAALYAGVASVYHWNEDGSLTSGDSSSGGVSSITGIYDSDIGVISGLSIDKIGAFNCHGSSDGFSNCFSLSWDVTNFDTSTYIEYYEMKFQIQYSYALNIDSSLSYGNGIYNYSEDGSVLCVPSLAGAHSFCAHDFYLLTGLDDELSFFDGNINRFNIHDLTKIFVRTVRQNKWTKDITYGDWAVVTITDWNNVLTGNRPTIGTTEIYAGGNNVNSDGTVNGDVSDVIEPEETEKGFSFAGIDLSDITSIGGFFIGLVESLVNIIGSFPSLFATIFGFLPFEIRNMIYVFLLVCVIAGLLKIFT